MRFRGVDETKDDKETKNAIAEFTHITSIDKDFKIIIIDIFKVLVRKVDSMHEIW